LLGELPVLADEVVAGIKKCFHTHITKQQRKQQQNSVQKKKNMTITSELG
jgi:hypothetical protein